MAGDELILPESLQNFKPRPFVPAFIHFTKSGNELKVWWDETEAYADDQGQRVVPLRAHSDNDLVTGVKVWGIMEIFGKFLPRPDPLLETERQAEFKPYAWHDLFANALRIRWLPGTAVEDHLVSRTPLTLLRDAAKAKIILGVKIPGINRLISNRG